MSLTHFVYGLLLGIGWAGCCMAQAPAMEHLKQELAHTSQPTQKVALLCRLSQLAQAQDPEAALGYAQEALSWSTRYRLHQPMVQAHLQLATLWMDRDTFTQASDHLLNAQQLLRQTSYAAEQVHYAALQGKLYIKQRAYLDAITILRAHYDTYPQVADSLKRALLIPLANALQRQRDWETAHYYLKERLTLKTVEDSVVVYEKLGTLHARQQDYTQALPYYEKSLLLAQRTQNRSQESRTLLNIGNISLLEGDWRSAIDDYSRSAALKAELGDEAGLAILNHNIASIYMDQERYQESLEYYLKSRAYYQSIQDSTSLAENNVNIAAVLMQQKEYAQAIERLRGALPFLDQPEHASTRLVAYINLAFAHSETGAYPAALKQLRRADLLTRALEDYSSRITIANLYGACFFYLKNYAAAIKHYKEALVLSRDLERIDEEQTALFGLYESEQRRQRYAAALPWLEQYRIIHDSILHAHMDQRLLDIQEKYDSQQKEKEIEELNIKNRNIELENRLQQEEFQNLLLVASLVGGLLLALAVLLVYRQRQQKKLLVQTKALHSQEVNQLMDQQALETLDAVLEAQRGERRSLAKEIHDTLGSYLATLRYQHEASKAPGEEADAQYIKMEHLIGQASQEVRQIAHQMATGERLSFDLMMALEQLVERIRDTQRLEVRFQYFGERSDLPQDVELTLYRIIQELFANILKHAQATQATLQINQHETEWLITLEDNGKGFEKTAAFKANGLGLKNLQERMARLKGQIEWDTQLGRGTTVVLTLPNILHS